MRVVIRNVISHDNYSEDHLQCMWGGDESKFGDRKS